MINHKLMIAAMMTATMDEIFPVPRVLRERRERNAPPPTPQRNATADAEAIAKAEAKRKRKAAKRMAENNKGAAP